MKTINRLRTYLQNLGGIARDERGFVQASQTVLLVVITSLGMVAGLVALRDGIVQEYADMGLALENLNQSYNYQITIPDPMDPAKTKVICQSTYTDYVGSLAPTTNVKDGSTGTSPGHEDMGLLDPTGAAGYQIQFKSFGAEGVALFIPPPGRNQIAPTHEGVALPLPPPGNNQNNNSTPPTPEN